MGFDRQIGSDTDNHQAGSCQSGSNLCDWTDPNHFTTACRKTSLDELPGSGEFGQIRSIHPREGVCMQL